MLNVAIIGTGNIARKHIAGYLEFPERCTITGMMDLYQDSMDTQIASFGLKNVKTTSDPKVLAADPAIDVVSICTPPSSHAELAIMFLNAGKHVLLEKPMAPSLEECEAIRAAAEKSGKVFSVVAQNRFRTPAWRMKKILDSGILGAIRHVQVHSFWYRTRAYYDMDWRGTWESEGGGCTLNHSVHQIDLMLWMTGMPYEITSIMDNVGHDNSEVEDLSISLMRFKPHAIGQLTSSLVHHGEGQSVTVQAEKGSISTPWEPKASMGRVPDDGFIGGDNKEFLAELDKMYNSIPALKHEQHAGQIGDVLDAIEQKRQPLIGAVDGINAINVIQGIYKSACDKAPVALPLPKTDAFYTNDGILKVAPRFYKKLTSKRPTVNTEIPT